jgi:hypothetical protein
MEVQRHGKQKPGAFRAGFAAAVAALGLAAAGLLGIKHRCLLKE